MAERKIILNPISKEEAVERLLDNDLIFEVEDHCYNESSADYSIRVVVKEITDEEGETLPNEYRRYGFFQGSDAIELLEAMIKMETERMI